MADTFVGYSYSSRSLGRQFLDSDELKEAIDVCQKSFYHRS